MIINKLTSIGAAVLFIVSVLVVGSVFAEEGDKDRLREQDQVRTEANLQDPDKDQAQARERVQERLRESQSEENMAKQRKQIRNENQYRENLQSQQRTPMQGAKAR